MQPSEKTLILLKSDALERGLAGAILARFERAGLRVEDCRFVRPTAALLEQHYADLRARNLRAFERSTQFMTGKPIAAIILSGPNAIQKTRTLLGPTDPSVAPAGTIRGDFGSDSIALADAQSRGTLNLVHAADSPDSVRREMAIWFPQAEA
jgi:nucleoside-diphosphate kinase